MSLTNGKRNLKRSVIDKPCLQCGSLLKSKLLLFPSTCERVKYCNRICKNLYWKGKSPTTETRQKMSKAHMGNKSNTGRKLPPEHLFRMSLAFRGEKHWNWKGGKTKENHLRRNQLEYKVWRKSVFERDGYKCKIDNKDCVHEVHAHHILRFAEHKELRFDVNNGITLCKNHHPLGREGEKNMELTYKKLIQNVDLST